MSTQSNKIISYLIVGIILSQLFSLTSSSFSLTQESTVIAIEKDVEILLISDETGIQVISDEASVTDTSRIKEVIKKQGKDSSQTTRALILAKNMSNNELLELFVDNKKVFQGRVGGDYDYDDFIQAWKNLSQGYSQKSDTEILVQKQRFITVYLSLHNKEEESLSPSSTFTYEDIDIVTFEKNLLQYLDEHQASETHYSNGRKLIKIVEIYKQLPESGRKKDMQKSIYTQFGRTINGL